MEILVGLGVLLGYTIIPYLIGKSLLSGDVPDNWFAGILVLFAIFVILSICYGIGAAILS